MKKGIIAAPGEFSGKGSEFRFGRMLAPEQLRYFLLYWDRVVIPSNNIVHLAVPEEEELLSTGVFTRPSVPFSGVFNGETMAKAQLDAQALVAKDLIENDRSVDWVLHQLGNEIVLPDELALERQLVRVEIANCLPVPPGSTHIPDILEFKERRKDELELLHRSIDQLYFEILRSPDPSLQSKQALSDFQKSIVALNAVSQERWGVSTSYSLSAELNLSGKDLLAGAAAAAAFGFFLHPMVIPVAGVIGAVASAVNIRASWAKTFEPSKEKSVLGYLVSARDEGVLRG